MRSSLLVFLLILFGSPLAAQDNDDGVRKSASAIRIAEDSIDLDGRLDEGGWQTAPPITDFVQKEPIEGAAPTERMEIRFAYDAGALYVGARMYSRAPVQAPMGRRDDLEEQSENIIVSLDTFLDRRTAYSFGVSASGVRLDRFHRQDDEEAIEAGFDPVWNVKTRIDELGWTAEMWIPFSQLRFNNEAEQVWGLNVRRFTPNTDEQVYWVLVPRTERAWASRFGNLSGIAGIRAPRRLELLPFVVASSAVNGRADPADPFQAGANAAGRAGLDLKIGLGPNLTLQATINPDFGQVEADPAEVNLSALPTRFTEKRPFFVEDAELLNIGQSNFFYSRRIGERPAGSASGDFVEYPTGTTILGAAKLTGRVRPRTSLGILTAVTGSEFARVANVGSPQVASVRVAPPAIYGMGRVQQEFGRLGSTASVMAAGGHRSFDAGDSLAMLARDAVIVAGDALLRFKGGEYELRASGGGTLVRGEPLALQRIQLSNRHYAQRPDKDYSTFDPTLTSMSGYQWSSSLNRISGRHWLYGIPSKIDSPGFEPEYGFVNFADGIEPSAFLRYRETRPGRIFRNYSLEMRQTNEWNFGWDLQTAVTRPSVNVTWENFWTSSLSVDFNRPTSSAKVTRGGPRMIAPGGWTSTARVANNATSQTRWSGTATLGSDDEGGRTNRINGTFSFRPGPRWQLGVTPLYERLLYTQQYVATLAGGRPEIYGKRYVFATIDRTTFSTQYRLNFTLKPDLNLDVYAEPFTASGRYYDYGELFLPGGQERLVYGTSIPAVTLPDGSLQVSPAGSPFTLASRDFNARSFRSTIVARYEWRPGSTLYVVWQQDRSAQDPVGSRVGVSDMFQSIIEPGQHVFLVKTSLWLPVR